MTAKVHVVKSEYTTAQIRNSNLAQQNPRAGNKGRPACLQCLPWLTLRRVDGLYNYFHQAIGRYAGPFQVFKGESEGPVIAGLILDSQCVTNSCARGVLPLDFDQTT